MIYFQVLLVLGQLTFYNQNKSHFVSYTGKPGGCSLGTTTIGETWGKTSLDNAYLF